MNSVALNGHHPVRNSRCGDAPAAFEGPDLPVQVRRLARREREVATIVYRRGATTANEALSLLAGRISNGAVRSMLNRLVGKGILKRRRAGRGKALAYVPAITVASTVEREFARFAEDYFGGSTEQALNAITQLQGGRGSGPVRLHGAASGANDRVPGPEH